MSYRVMFRPDLRITGFKVFAATMHEHRARLGETVTAWIEAHPGLSIVDITVSQSSDAAFHCISFVVAYADGATIAA